MVRSNRRITDYQKALALSNAFDFSSPHRDIKVSTYAILFFGTPHHGANGVELAQWMGKLLSVYMYTNETILKDLNRDSSELESIQKFYLGACEHIKSIFFYETLHTPICRGVAQLVSSLDGREMFSLTTTKIVPRHLAIIEGDRNALVVELHADHRQIVKFQKGQEYNYRKTVGYLSQLIKEAPREVEKNWIREKGYRSASACLLLVPC
jgi:hypothetical protein